MSQIVTTDLGRFRRVGDGVKDWWLWECRCGQWCSLSEDQMAGKISVNHAADGCKVGYHETHEFGKQLLAALQAAIFMGDAPTTEDTDR